MQNRLRRILFSVPVITAVGLIVLYLAIGFFALPAVLKWQLEKQVRETLGHRLSVAQLRFNPLNFKLDAEDLALADAEGGAMAGFKRLHVDFELRSLIDRAWTFAEASLDAPTLRFVLAPDGKHNFSALLDRLGSGDSEPALATALPRFAVQRLAISKARIEFSDRLLAEPLVMRIEPLSFEIDALSSLPARSAAYRLSVPTAAGESLTANGSLALSPMSLKGKLALNKLKVATVVRGLSRLVALAAPGGEINAAAELDLALNAQGALSGSMQDVEFAVAGLSLSAPGAVASKLALETIELKKGLVGFDNREARITSLRLAKGGISASTDEQGRLDWANIVRSASAAPQGGSSVAGGEAAQAPWRIVVANAELAAIAFEFADSAGARSASIGEVGLGASSSAEFGPAGVQLALDNSRLSLAATRVRNGNDTLNVPQALIEAGKLSFAAGNQGFELTLDSPRIAAEAGLSAKQGEALLSLGGLQMQGGRAEIGDSTQGFSVAIDAPRIGLTGVLLSQGGQRAQWRDASFEADRLTLQAGADPLSLGIESPQARLGEMQLQQGDAELALRSALIGGKQVSMKQGGAGLLFTVNGPGVAVAGLAGRQAEAGMQADSVSIDGASLSINGGSDGKLDLRLEATKAAAAKLALNIGSDGLDLGQVSIGGQSVSLQQADGRLDIIGKAVQAAITGAAGRQGKDRLELQDASLTAGALSFSPGAQAEIDDALLSLSSLGIVALGAADEFAGIGAAKIGAKSLRLALPDGAFDLSGQGLSANLSETSLRNPTDAAELLQLGSAILDGGALALRERSFSADKLMLANGTLETWLDEQGRFNLGTLFASESPAAATGTAPAAGPDDAPAWRIALKSGELDGIAVGFEDRRESPAFALALEAIRARVSGLDSAAAAPMQIDASASLASGGTIEAHGGVVAGNGASDLNIKVSKLALAPVQSYLSKFADLRLASGDVSTEGRLRHGDLAGAGAKLNYQGKLAVDRLLLEEIEPKRPFLAWETVATDDLVLTLEPDRLDIGELRLDRPAGRFIIAADQTVNLSDVLKTQKESHGGSAAAAKPAAEPFPVSIARLRISEGTLEFADLSLRPQFGARMHELKGVVTGLGTDPSNSARMQLDARVDQYGSAKIRGQLSVFEPETFTEIDMAFRNLEMTSLSPYVAKFAGYRIAGGRLSLDLQYRVKASKLLGENKIELKQVELGEKVESADALDLPLDLAIAILKDSDGVIDIGLPVSGDLNDPQFDYGTVVGKAIGNLLGGIVTAPFRALGALFGGGDKKIDSIEFEPGRDAIAPPERQKLAAVARALSERPALALVVPSTHATAQDSPVLKSQAVRSEIVKGMGIELAPGEDPGPIDVANARAQAAIEAVFSRRYAPEVFNALKRRAVAAASPAGTAASAPPAAAQAASAALASAPAASGVAAAPKPPPAFYQGLVDRLIAEHPLAEQALAELATRRGAAIVRELTGAGGVPAARITLAPPRPASEADDKVVALRLELGVAR